MPIDDPGWGDQVPAPGDKPAQQQPPQQQPPPVQQQPQTQVQPPAAAPAPSLSGPSPFADPKVRMVLGGIVALALAAGAYFMFFSGDDSDEPDARPAAAAGQDDSGDDSGDSGDIGTMTLQDYVSAADQICSGYAADIQAASQAQDLQALAQADQAMLDQIRQLPPPDQSAAEVEQMLSDFQLAIDALAVNDFQTAQQYASQAASTGTQLGFVACVQ